MPFAPPPAKSSDRARTTWRRSGVEHCECLSKLSVSTLSFCRASADKAKQLHITPPTKASGLINALREMRSHNNLLSALPDISHAPVRPPNTGPRLCATTTPSRIPFHLESGSQAHASEIIVAPALVTRTSFQYLCGLGAAFAEIHHSTFPVRLLFKVAQYCAASWTARMQLANQYALQPVRTACFQTRLRSYDVVTFTVRKQPERASRK